MPISTCQNCQRNVLVVVVGGEKITTDTELIMVVTAREVDTSKYDGGRRAVMRTTTTWARRVHADMCETYRNAAQREKLQREQREYNRRNGRARTPRRNDGL